jgi:hypothetical protein
LGGDADLEAALTKYSELRSFRLSRASGSKINCEPEEFISSMSVIMLKNHVDLNNERGYEEISQEFFKKYGSIMDANPVKKMILVERYLSDSNEENRRDNQIMKQLSFYIRQKYAGIHSIQIKGKNDYYSELSNGIDEVISLEERIFLSDFDVNILLENDLIKSTIETKGRLREINEEMLTYRFFIIRNNKVIFNSGRVKEPTFDYKVEKNGAYLIQGYVHCGDHFQYKKSNTVEYYTDTFKKIAEDIRDSPISYVPSLAHTRRQNPFQDIVVYIGSSTFDITRYVSEFGLTEATRIESEELGTISLFSEESITTGDSVRCFSGFVKSGDRILFGPDELCGRDISDENYGCFTCATIDKDKGTLHFFRDFCSYGKIYMYEYSGEYILSNRYGTLLRLLVRMGYDISFDYEKTLLYLTTFNYVLLQNFVRQMDVMEITQLTPESEVFICGNDINLSVNTEVSRILSCTNDVDYRQYEKKIREAADEVRENVRCGLISFPEVMIDLTGGLDSRVVFAALTSLKIDSNKIYINTRGKIEDEDVKLAVDLNSLYSYHFMNKKIQANKREFFDSDVFWRNEFLGTIYSGVGSSLHTELVCEITGGTGDAFARPEYSRHYFDDVGEYSENGSSMAEAVWQKQVLSSSIINSSGTHRTFTERLTEEMDKITGSSFMEKYDLIYFFYRNGYHFNPEPEYNNGTFVWMPLQSKKLFELYHITHDTFRSARLELDLIKALNPLLVEIPFASEKDNVDFFKNEYNLIGNRAYYLKNIAVKPKETMDKWVESTKNRGYVINNKVNDHGTNEDLVLRLINKLKILFRVRGGYYFKEAGYGLVYYILSNLSSAGRMRTLYYKISSIIDQVRIISNDESSDHYALCTDLLTNGLARLELQSIVEKVGPEINE